MSARSRLVGLVPGLVIGGGAGATLTSGSSGGSSLSWIREAIPDLGARLKAAIALPPSAAPAADSAALTASVAAIQTAVMSLERAMRMQALSPLRSALFFAVVAAGGLAVYRYGWDRIGWVTLNELRLGLGNVKASVEAMVGGLREELCSQLVGVRQQLDRTVVTVQATSADVIAVKSDIRAMAESVFAMEARLESVETASQRSADGVEILVSLVATSQLFAGATPETAHRLSRFSELQGPRSALQSGALELRHKQADRGALPSPPAAPPPPPPGTPRAQPGYLQSILLQSAGN